MRNRVAATILAALMTTVFAMPVAAQAASPSTAPSAVDLTVPGPAPKPTSGAVSPDAPDPRPPLGGRAPDGSVPGGAQLLSRGILVPKSSPPLPADLTSLSWVLSDLDTGQILAARDPHGRYQPASVLKLLTAITTLPNLPGNEVVTVSPQAANAEGSAVGLLAGAKYSIDNLYQALFLVSGNDAAAAVAEANGGISKTVADMNATAHRLGAYDTYVQTPSGLDGWQQLTSAYDLSLVLRVAVHMPRLLAYDKLHSATYPAKQSAAGKVGAYEFDNQSNNFLDTVPGAILAKTGYTDAALHTFVAATDRNGRRLGVVFLRNQRTPLDQWQQAAALLNWGYALPKSATPVGTLIEPNGPSPAAASNLPTGAQPTYSTALDPPPAQPSAGQPLANLAAPLLPGQTPVRALAERRSTGGTAQLTVITVCLLLAAVAGLRVRRHLRRRRRQQVRPPAQAMTGSSAAGSARRR